LGFLRQSILVCFLVGLRQQWLRLGLRPEEKAHNLGWIRVICPQPKMQIQRILNLVDAIASLVRQSILQLLTKLVASQLELLRRNLDGGDSLGLFQRNRLAHASRGEVFFHLQRDDIHVVIVDSDVTLVAFDLRAAQGVDKRIHLIRAKLRLGICRPHQGPEAGVVRINNAVGDRDAVLVVVAVLEDGHHLINKDGSVQRSLILEHRHRVHHHSHLDTWGDLRFEHVRHQ
jgi:hypothetical protein